MNDLPELCRVVAAEHTALLGWVTGARPDPAAPSALPGWTVGHVLTHLARNAEGLTRIVEGARRGERTAMYPEGSDGRAAAIEDGARRPLEALTEDLAATGAMLCDAWSTLDDAGWSGAGISLRGERAVADTPLLRAAEVVVHRFDIDPGYTPDRWPRAYVRHDVRRMSMLWSARRPMGLAALPEPARRLDDATRLAWLYDRIRIDDLAPAAVEW